MSKSELKWHQKDAYLKKYDALTMKMADSVLHNSFFPTSQSSKVPRGIENIGNTCFISSAL